MWSMITDQSCGWTVARLQWHGWDCHTGRRDLVFGTPEVDHPEAMGVLWEIYKVSEICSTWFISKEASFVLTLKSIQKTTTREKTQSAYFALCDKSWLVFFGMRQEWEEETPNESLDGSALSGYQLNGLANLIRLGSELLLCHGIVRYIPHILHWLIKGSFFCDQAFLCCCSTMYLWDNLCFIRFQKVHWLNTASASEPWLELWENLWGATN